MTRRVDTSALEPARTKPDDALSARMGTYPRRDTVPELSLRRALHARGFRYRVQYPVPGNRRRKIDIAFLGMRLAVFVDGCFWHGCPEHGSQPVTNAEWWRWKLERNQTRDEDTDLLLADLGWEVLRVWEHEPTDMACDRVAEAVRARQRARRRSVPSPG